jgi:hypothetical protein
MSNLTPDYSAWAGIGAAASAITSIVAAVAAWRSAGTARAAIDQAAQDHRRALLREADLAIKRVLAEGARIEELAAKLCLAYTSLFAFTGHSAGSSLLAVNKQRVEQKRVEGVPMLAGARECSERDVETRTDDDLAAVARTMEGYVVRLEKIKESLLFDLHGVEAQHHMYHENAVQKGFGVGPR